MDVMVIARCVSLHEIILKHAKVKSETRLFYFCALRNLDSSCQRKPSVYQKNRWHIIDGDTRWSGEITYHVLYTHNFTIIQGGGDVEKSLKVSTFDL